MMKFDWSNFEIEFIKSIIFSPKTNKNLEVPRKSSDKDALIPTMERIAPYPSKEFIVNYRWEIESKLLRNYPDLVKKIYRDIFKSKMGNHLGALNELSKRELSPSLINRYMTAISEIGNPNYSYEAISLFAQPITIDLTKSKASELKLYDFQEDAVEKLKRNLIIEDFPSGMLVMPTGERVIIVMGAINVLVSRVSRTFIKNNSYIA